MFGRWPSLALARRRFEWCGMSADEDHSGDEVGDFQLPDPMDGFHTPARTPSERVGSAFSTGVRGAQAKPTQRKQGRASDVIEPHPRVIVTDDGEPTYVPSSRPSRLAWDGATTASVRVYDPDPDDDYVKFLNQFETSLRERLRNAERAAANAGTTNVSINGGLHGDGDADETASTASQRLSSAYRTVSSLSPAGIQAMAQERNMLRERLRKTQLELAKAQAHTQAAGVPPESVDALRGDLGRIERLRRAMDRAVSEQTERVVLLQRLALMAEQRQRAAEDAAKAAGAERARAESQLADSAGKLQDWTAEREALQAAAAQKLAQALQSQQQQLNDKAQADIKHAVAMAESRCRETAARALQDQLAASERRAEAAAAERARVAAVEARTAALEESAQAARRTQTLAATKDAQLAERAREVMAREHATALQALQQKLQQQEDRHERELARLRADAEQTLKRRLEEQRKSIEGDADRGRVSAVRAAETAAKTTARQAWDDERQALVRRLTEESNLLLQQKLAAQKTALEDSASKERTALIERMRRDHAKDLARATAATTAAETKAKELEAKLQGAAQPSPRRAPATPVRREASSDNAIRARARAALSTLQGSGTFHASLHREATAAASSLATARAASSDAVATGSVLDALGHLCAAVAGANTELGAAPQRHAEALRAREAALRIEMRDADLAATKKLQAAQREITTLQTNVRTANAAAAASARRAAESSPATAMSRSAIGHADFFRLWTTHVSFLLLFLLTTPPVLSATLMTRQSDILSMYFPTRAHIRSGSRPPGNEIAELQAEVARLREEHSVMELERLRLEKSLSNFS
eukprot:m.41741 g.41741  ORF g.41741 m.41741 type:complete len:828 (+) comp5687_c0_seq2:1782-4265(+)